MAARNLAPVRALHREMVIIAGSFAPNGASAVDATTRTGVGFTVARTSAGLFTVTLTGAQKYNYLLSAQATFQTATAQDLVPQISAISLSAKTFEIRLNTGAVATDATAAATTRVNFILVFSQSGQLPVRG